MSLIFTPDEIEQLRSPHIFQAWFLQIEMPDGATRLHNGCGRRIVDGVEWTGITNPFSGVIVSLDGVEEPEFGQAASVNVVLSGADREFMKYMRSIVDQLEGAECELYWGAFNQYEQIVIGGLKALFPKGHMSAPSFQWEGIGQRDISFTIEGIWTQMNYAAGRRWNAADQQRAYAGDLGCNFAGVKILESLR